VPQDCPRVGKEFVALSTAGGDEEQVLQRLRQKSVTEIAIPGGWTEETVTLGTRAFHVLLPADADALLESLELLAQDGVAVRDPYWARLWPCAHILAESIARRPWPQGVSALELGCGAGLPGLAALAQGLDVTFSDCEPLAVALALENAQRNGFTAAHGYWLDWHQPQPVRFPIIFGSDVIYDAALHPILLELLRQMLTGEGSCWLADPGRFHAASFVQRAADTGFHAAIYDELDQEHSTLRSGQYQRIVLRKKWCVAPLLR